MPASENIYMWVTEDTDEGRKLFSIFRYAQELWCWAQKDKIIKICDDQTRDFIENEVVKTAKDGTTTVLKQKQSDNTAVNRDRLRVQTRQWAMNKLLTKIFGDKIQQEVTGPQGGAIKYEQVVDKPPAETPEEWQARVQKQLESKGRKPQA